MFPNISCWSSQRIMSTCPICNNTVKIKNINAHIDSNCISFIQRKIKLKKTQSDLTQYFHKQQCKTKTVINTTNTCSKKRKRDSNDNCNNIEPPIKRLKICNSNNKQTKQSIDIDNKKKK
eukprot:139951_1